MTLSTALGFEPLALGHNFSLKTMFKETYQKFLKGQKIYCRDEKGKRFGHKIWH